MDCRVSVADSLQVAFEVTNIYRVEANLVEALDQKQCGEVHDQLYAQL